MTTGVVGNSATRMKPVPNTPTSEPAVPSASTRPTTRPVCSTSRSWALTVSGLTALSRAAGRKNAIAARKMMVSGLDAVGARAEGADDRHRGDRRAAAEREGDGEQGRGSMRSARRPPHHVPGGDAGEDDADHAGERLQRHADVRRHQAPGERLEHEDAARTPRTRAHLRSGPAWPDRTGAPAGHRPDGPVRAAASGRRPRPVRSRPILPSRRSCSGASSGTGDLRAEHDDAGPEVLGDAHLVGDLPPMPGHSRSTSSGSIVSSWPAARARSQPWSTRSALTTPSTCSARPSSGPIGVSHSASGDGRVGEQRLDVGAGGPEGAERVVRRSTGPG